MLYCFIALPNDSHRPILCNLHVMLRATNDFNCLEQERRVTFVGLVERLIHSDHTFQYYYVQFLIDSMKTVKALRGNI
jgi:hypothetical protein